MTKNKSSTDAILNKRADWTLDSLKQCTRKTFRDDEWFDSTDYFVTYSFGSGMHVQSFKYFDFFKGDNLKLLQTLVQTQTILVKSYPEKCEPFDKNDVRLPLIITYEQHGDRVGKFEWKHQPIVQSDWKKFVTAVWDVLCTAAEETEAHTTLLENFYGVFQTIYKKANLVLPVAAVEPNTNSPNNNLLYVRKLNGGTTTDQVREVFEQYGTVNSIDVIRDAGKDSLGATNTHMLVAFQNAANTQTAKAKLHLSKSDLTSKTYATEQQLMVEFAESHLAVGTDNNLLQYAPEPKDVQIFVESGFITGYQGGFRYFMVVPATNTVYCFTGFNEAR
jgi:hypothetical protein